MAVSIQSAVEGDTLAVVATGTVNIDAAVRLMTQIFDTAAENGVNKILVNCLAVDGELEPFERYRLGQEVAAYVKLRRLNVRLAFVGTPPTVSGFSVQIARNRGVAAGVFRTVAEARSWIAESDPKDGPESA